MTVKLHGKISRKYTSKTDNTVLIKVFTKLKLRYNLTARDTFKLSRACDCDNLKFSSTGVIGFVCDLCFDCTSGGSIYQTIWQTSANRVLISYVILIIPWNLTEKGI